MLKILNMVRDVKKLKVCQDVEGLKKMGKIINMEKPIVDDIKKMGKFINMEKPIVDDIMNRALFINIIFCESSEPRKKC